MSTPRSWLARLQGQDLSRPHPWTVLFCAAVIGLCTPRVDIAGIFAAAAVGSLLALNARLQSRILVLVLLAALVVNPERNGSLSYWLVLAQATIPAFASRPSTWRILDAPRWTWQALVIVEAAGICAMLLGYGPIPTTVALLASFYLGANITRHVAMTNARLLVWGDEGLVAVTRDLLLGRVTSGMLHDLAQPLNVISMANGNLGYIAEHLEIEDEERRQLLERIERIAHHTQGAAAILSLFRWFGRDGSDDPAELTVRSALERAVAATRSNVRHHDVAVELQGNGLDYLLPTRHGSLEMIAVAALLCAFGSFIARDGTKRRGKVLLQATLSPAHVLLSVQCADLDGHAIPGKHMDHATVWLVEQVAHEASGDFRPILRHDRTERFRIRLGRDDT